MEASHPISSGNSLQEDSWTCNRCGWVYPNPHPSAKHRRNHKKHCGKIKGSQPAAERHKGGSSDDVSSGDDEAHTTEGALSDVQTRDRPSLKEPISGDIEVNKPSPGYEIHSEKGSSMGHSLPAVTVEPMATSKIAIVPSGIMHEEKETSAGPPSNAHPRDLTSLQEPLPDKIEPSSLPAAAEAASMVSQPAEPIVNNIEVGSYNPPIAVQGVHTDAQPEELISDSMEVGLSSSPGAAQGVNIAVEQAERGNEESLGQSAAILAVQPVELGEKESPISMMKIRPDGENTDKIGGSAGEIIKLYPPSEGTNEDVNQAANFGASIVTSRDILHQLDKNPSPDPPKLDSSAAHTDASKVDDDIWTCQRCGWTYPNAHPSAKHRRNHKKVCGKVKGANHESMPSADLHNGSSGEASSDEEITQHKVLEEGMHGNATISQGSHVNSLAGPLLQESSSIQVPEKPNKGMTDQGNGESAGQERELSSSIMSPPTLRASPAVVLNETNISASYLPEQNVTDITSKPTSVTDMPEGSVKPGVLYETSNTSSYLPDQEVSKISVDPTVVTDTPTGTGKPSASSDVELEATDSLMAEEREIFSREGSKRGDHMFMSNVISSDDIAAKDAPLTEEAVTNPGSNDAILMSISESEKVLDEGSVDSEMVRKTIPPDVQTRGVMALPALEILPEKGFADGSERVGVEDPIGERVLETEPMLSSKVVASDLPSLPTELPATAHIEEIIQPKPAEGIPETLITPSAIVDDSISSHANSYPPDLAKQALDEDTIETRSLLKGTSSRFEARPETTIFAATEGTSADSMPNACGVEEPVNALMAGEVLFEPASEGVQVTEKETEIGFGKGAMQHISSLAAVPKRSDSLDTDHFEDARDSLGSFDEYEIVDDPSGEADQKLKGSTTLSSSTVDLRTPLPSEGFQEGRTVGTRHEAQAEKSSMSDNPGVLEADNGADGEKSMESDVSEAVKGEREHLYTINDSQALTSALDDKGASVSDTSRGTQDLKAPSPEAWQEPSEGNRNQTEELVQEETVPRATESEVREDKDGKRHTPLRSLLANEGSQKIENAAAVEGAHKEANDATDSKWGSRESKQKTRSIWSHCICCPAVH